MIKIHIGKTHGRFSQSFSCFILGVSAGYYQRDLVGESGMIRTQMARYSRSVMVAVYGTRAIPRNQ
jgi:hypothetical protein